MNYPYMSLLRIVAREIGDNGIRTEDFCKILAKQGLREQQVTNIIAAWVAAGVADDSIGLVGLYPDVVEALRSKR